VLRAVEPPQSPVPNIGGKTSGVLNRRASEDMNAGYVAVAGIPPPLRHTISWEVRTKLPSTGVTARELPGKRSPAMVVAKWAY